jgi:hypothetical protein
MTQSISPSVPPPYEDRDCHRPPALKDYTTGYMVRTRVIGAPSQWRAVFSDHAEAMLEVEHVMGLRLTSGDRLYIEVALWHQGRPMEIWKNGKPQMARATA